MLRFSVAIMLILAAATAHADPTRKARELFQEGTALYDLGKYLEAAQKYEEVYKLKQEPALLFNLGQAYRLGGAEADAIRAYRSYLRRKPDASNRAEVERLIATLQQRIDDRQGTAAVQPNPSPTDKQPAARMGEPATAAPVAPKAPELALASHPAPARPTPIYKKWWLWTTVGLVVAAGVGVGVGVAATTPKDAPAPNGSISLIFQLASH